MNIILYIICTDRIWIGGDLISYVMWHSMSHVTLFWFCFCHQASFTFSKFLIKYIQLIDCVKFQQFFERSSKSIGHLHFRLTLPVSDTFALTVCGVYYFRASYYFWVTWCGVSSCDLMRNILNRRIRSEN